MGKGAPNCEGAGGGRRRLRRRPAAQAATAAIGVAAVGRRVLRRHVPLKERQRHRG